MYEEVQTRLATFGKLSMLSALGRLSSSIQRRFTMALLPCQEQEISLKWKSRHTKLKVIPCMRVNELLRQATFGMCKLITRNWLHVSEQYFRAMPNVTKKANCDSVVRKSHE